MRGNNLGKMVKSCMKITKSAFLGQNNVGGGMGRGGGGGGGSKTSPCLKLVRIMLETLNLVLKYKHIFSYLVSENIPLVFRPL